MEGFGWSILVCYAVILLGEPSERRNIRVSFLGGSGKEIQVYGKERATGAVIRAADHHLETFFFFLLFFLHWYISTACVIRYPRHSNMADCT